MEGGGLAVKGHGSDFGGRITWAVVMTCVVAAFGGLLFGYDIGISGGVTTMVPFLEKFFPSILRKAADTKTDIYCVYDSQALTAFTSSLYLAGLVASLVASRLTTTFGRKFTMILGGCTFLVGAAINGASENVAMLIIGRIFLGLGVGFTNQATPLYLSEVAPAKWRGTFNTGFQFFLGVGVVVSNCINFGTSKHKWGWRLSLGLAVVPALIMTIGALLITDTPTSLVERGKIDDAKRSLTKIRGDSVNVEAEIMSLIKASEASKEALSEPFFSIFERRYRPYLVMAFMIPSFQQLSGINVIAFYAPVLFQSVGFGSDSALIASIILGSVNLGAILVSSLLVDRLGRRVLFLEGGIQMFVCQVVVAAVLATSTGVSHAEHISKAHASLVLILMCVYSAGFGWSWGPLTWLVPSEIFPMKIRTTGQGLTVAVDFAITFVLSQTFLAMLCHFKYGVFLFYAGWIVVMTVFVWLFLPETKGVPLESMHEVFEQHWFWKRYLKDEC